jgi:two-component system nitrogen regulation sensor histidine kinase GlnL
LGGGLYDCNIQPLENQHLLVEFHSLEWEQQKQQLLQREIQTGLLDLLRRNLGHEIRNPLGGIRGAAQMMAAELGEQELGTLARLVMREVDRIEDLIQKFWQPEAEREEVDIHAVAEEALELAVAEFGDQIRVTRDYDPSIPFITGDSQALRRLMLNLVRNACQAGATALKVRTRIEIGSAFVKNGPGTALRFELEDDGEGVPDELRPLLFMPMVTGRRDGTGLGLALAQQIADAHGGILTFEALDRGSRFSLRLPLNDEEEARADG